MRLRHRSPHRHRPRWSSGSPASKPKRRASRKPRANSTSASSSGASDIARTEVRREELRASIQQTERLLDEDVRAIEDLRAQMRRLDEQVVALRGEFSAADHAIRGARARARNRPRGE